MVANLNHVSGFEKSIDASFSSDEAVSNLSKILFFCDFEITEIFNSKTLPEALPGSISGTCFRFLKKVNYSSTQAKKPKIWKSRETWQ